METKEAKTKKQAEGTVAEKIKGMNLVAKILLMAMVPLVLMGIVAMFAIQGTGSATAEKMAQQELATEPTVIKERSCTVITPVSVTTWLPLPTSVKTPI